MKWKPMVLWICVLLLAGCENSRKQQELDDRAAALDSREQELLLREKTLAMREEELNTRTNMADSVQGSDTARVDSALRDSTAHPHINPALAGNWQVKMTCTETSCPGSAVGDTRNEQWQLSYTGNHLVAKAMDRGKLVRTYSGLFNPTDIELIEHRDSAMVYDARMVVRLRPIDENAMEGRREIVMENECKIVYALTLSKLK